MKHRIFKVFACFVAINLLAQIFFPTVAFALTDGPSQPEVESFEPITTNQMVDLFSGDFTYNIPLFDVGGYPVNLHYNGSVTMEQEASWVGLGWNINPGVIQRNVQGIPDDFLGDEIETKNAMKPSVGVVLNASFSKEIFGNDSKFKSLNGASFSILYNNYKGLGIGVSKSFNLLSNSSPDDKGVKTIHKLDLGLSYNSFSGIGIDPSYSKEVQETKDTYEGKTCTYTENSSRKLSVGMNYSSMSGLAGMSFSRSAHTSTATKTKDPSRAADNQYDKGLKNGANGGVGISFLNQVFTPAVNPNLRNLSISLAGSFGKEILGVYNAKTFGVNVSVQGVKKSERHIFSKAYGVRYLGHMSNNEDRVMMDAFNHAASPISKNTVFLTNNALAKDILNVNGQGISGVYAPQTSAVGSYIPQRTKSVATQNIGGAFQVGLTKDVKIGVDLNFDIVSGKSGQWDENSGNKLSEFINFGNQGVNTGFEPVYFRNSGEMPRVKNNFFDLLDSNQAIAPNIDFIGLRTKLDGSFSWRNSSSSVVSKAISAPLVQNQREARNQQISILTKVETSKWGLIKYVNNDAPGHHYGEITVTNPDGGRYIYATPVYNNFQEEVSFSIGLENSDNNYSWRYTGQNPQDPCEKERSNNNPNTSLSGLIPYDAGDDSEDNDKGSNHLYSYKKVPRHAYSYLLNAIVSPDYQDIDGDGPSPSDYGSYVYIEYKQVHNSFKWRAPMYEDPVCNGKYANLSKGLTSNPNDDVASYIYGEKEIKYIETIRTKSHVAVFYTSEREDAHQAIDNGGGVDWGPNSAMHKLDRIEVYTIDEFDNIKYTSDPPVGRIPIKTVYFEYSYELCEGTPNSNAVNKGKLTLKSVSFSYGSNLSKVGKYAFEYGTGTAINPDYERLANDRWGNFKYPSTIDVEPEPPEFPYVNQNPATSPAGAWCMSKVYLPSGGNISVNYEQDDYAYVMDKKAMTMIQVVSQQEDLGSVRTENQLYGGDQNRPYIIFKKDPSKNIEDYASGLQYLYFNYYVKLNGTNDGGNDKYEYVSGYARIEDFGIFPGNSNYGYIKVKGEKYDQFSAWENANPISKAAWQFTMLNTPEIAFPGANKIRSVQQGSFKTFLGAMVSPISELMKAIVGFNRQSRVYQRAKSFDISKSSIRLFEPSGKKKGGGNRVSSIIFNDNWNSLSGSSEPTESFGQQYSYLLEDGKSSGVASYEPTIGNDENPFHAPGINGNIENLIRQSPLGINYGNSEYSVERNFLGFNKQQWLDIPVMEQYFPGAQVGYSKVTVKNLSADNDLINPSNDPTEHNGSGYQVKEFYTAKDYPTRWKVSEMDKQIIKNQQVNITDILGLSFGRAGASQGFSITTNDMHGKLKGAYAYDNDGNQISGTLYKYRSKDGRIESQELDNHMPVILPNGDIDYQALVGYEMETLLDPRQAHQSISKFQLHFDMDMFSVGVIPAIIAGIPLKYSFQYTETKSATMTKLIRQYGILEEVIAFDNGAQITTKNLALDSETGEVLVNSTQNEYGDLLYNITIPAHWVYSGMAHAYTNANLSFTTSVLNGIGDVSNSIGVLLEPGDELVTDNVLIGQDRTWILDVYDNTSNHKLSLIDKMGIAIPDGNYSFRIIRSGRKNQQITPIGKIVMKTNPMVPDLNIANIGKLDISNEINDYHVLNASAITYSDIWQLYQYDDQKYVTKCENDNVVFYNSEDFIPQVGQYLTDVFQTSDQKWFFKPGDIVNPYFTGLKGQWRPKTSFVYFDQTTAGTERKSVKGIPIVSESNTNFNLTSMREDGELLDFSPFWRVQSNGEWKNIKELVPTKDPWMAPIITTQISPNSMEQESKDAIGIYSSALFSGITKLPYAVAQNARLRNILNENFEDYIERYGFNCDDQINYSYQDESYNGFKEQQISTDFHHLMMNKQFRAPFHWFIWPKIQAGFRYSIETKKSHSGKQCLKATSGDLDIKIPIYGATAFSNMGQPLQDFKVNQSDLLDIFSPIPSNSDNDAGIGSRKYLLSYWISGETGSQDLSQAAIEVNGITLNPVNGQIYTTKVEGWTKRQFEIEIPTSMNYLEIKFTNPSGLDVYFDDLRIHPKESLMKTFVYDRLTLRLLATLDENNFATFFEYDNQGRLVRTKRETERGIVTISENRSHIIH